MPNITRLICHSLAIAITAVAVSTRVLQAAEAVVYTFSVTPQTEQRKLFSIWRPLIDELEKRTGQQFQLTSMLSSGEYDNQVRSGVYDFIYVNPYLVLQVAQNPGYIPLVRDSEPLRGILVVRKDSTVQRVEDLQGKSLAVASKQALGANLLLRAELDTRYGIQMQPVIAHTHNSTFIHVINGLTDAGGAIQRALDIQTQPIQENLRVLYRTSEVPPHPIAAHPRVPQAVREQVRQALLDMSNDPVGQSLLSKIPIKKPIPATANDYEVLRNLHLEKYLVSP